jgi:hypothetical protein
MFGSVEIYETHADAAGAQLSYVAGVQIITTYLRQRRSPRDTCPEAPRSLSRRTRTARSLGVLGALAGALVVAGSAAGGGHEESQPDCEIIWVIVDGIPVPIDRCR